MSFKEDEGVAGPNFKKAVLSCLRGRMMSSSSEWE